MVALGAGWGQPGPRGRGLNGAMLGSGVKWIRDGRGLSPYMRALLVKMIKMFANGNGSLHCIYEVFFSFNIFVDN